jgi:hypothetical protein
MSAGHISSDGASLIATHRSRCSVVLDYRAYSPFGYRYSKVVGTVIGPLKRLRWLNAESRTLVGAELRPQIANPGALDASLPHCYPAAIIALW